MSTLGGPMNSTTSSRRIGTGMFTPTQKRRVEFISPIERRKRYGIEAKGPHGDGITFAAGHWKPGGEYIHKLSIRNVTTSVKKLKYKLPESRYFSMPFPEEITLSAGMSRIIDVVFRPLVYENYDDAIYIKLLEAPGIKSSGGFYVPLKARIEQLIIGAPMGIDIGFAAAHQTTTAVFTITNDGEVDAPFRWEMPKPFTLQPSRGVIPFGKSQDITVSIFPEDASVYVAQATCYVGEGATAMIPEPVITTRLSAICKYTFLNLSEREVNFGEVLSGTPPAATKREIILRNNNVVPAEFSVIRHENDCEEVFEIYPRSGVIEPLGEITVLVRFVPLSYGLYSLDRYTFRTPGDCCVTLTCKGVSMPPKVNLYKESRSLPTPDTGPGADKSMSFDKSMEPNFYEASPGNSINFRDVEIGKASTRVFILSNDSGRDVTFSAVCDGQGTFEVEPKQGRLPAHTKYYPVKVKFAPIQPINYYRRIFVLVSDSFVQMFDVMGSGYIRAKGEVKEQRPMPLRHAHVQAYRNRLVAGLGGLDPDRLDALLTGEYNPVDPSEGMTAGGPDLDDIDPEDAYFAKPGFTGTIPRSISELKHPLTRSGEASRTNVAAAHEFFIDDTDKTGRVVTISKSMFDFGFTPYETNSISQTVSITNRTYGKVSVFWTVSSLRPAEGTMPHDRSMIGNAAERAKIHYSGQPESELGSGEENRPVFTITPSNVDIHPGKSASFSITFRPRTVNRNYVSELEAFVFFKNQRTFRLVRDETLTPPWCLPITACGHTFETGQLLAKVNLSGGCVKNGKLTFPVCYAGEAVYETVMIKNRSNLPCTFVVNLGWEGEGESDDAASAFAIKPTIGEIVPDGFALVCIRFTAKEARRKYMQLLRVNVNGAEDCRVLLQGQGDVPFLVCQDLLDRSIKDPFFGKHLDSKPIPSGFLGSFYLKSTCIGLSSTRPFALKNGSRLPLRFSVSVPPECAGIMAISPLGGFLKGNETIDLQITFAPREAKTHEFKVKIKCFPVAGASNRVLDSRQVGYAQPAEVVQDLRFTVVAPGEVGALVFDPPELAMSVRLVNTNETKDVYVENISESDIKYEFFYRTKFLSDKITPEMLRGQKPIAIPGPYQKMYVSREVADEQLIKEEQARMEAEAAKKGKKALRELGKATRRGSIKSFDPTDGYQTCFCMHPEGIIPARSRKRIPFTFFPSTSGLFEYAVYARIIAIDSETGKPEMLTNEETALLRVTQPFDQTLPPGGDVLQNFSLMSKISGRAAFPTLFFEDLRADIDQLVSEVDNLWNRFSFTRLNQTLAVPPTDEELKIFTKATPDLSKLTRFKFNFTPATVGSPTQTIHVRLRNNGFLKTSFRIQWPNQKVLDLETWCEEDTPSEEHNQMICIIEELMAFTVEPNSAVLEPGETCTLTISYKHSFLKFGGLHKIPLLVVVEQGKMFFLDLIGHTLANPPPPSPKKKKMTSFAAGTGMTSASSNALVHSSDIPALANPTTDMLFIIPRLREQAILHLNPVPIGLNADDAPLQRIEIINVSGYEAYYEVELKPLRSLCTENFKQPIVRVSNPVGVVDAYSPFYLDVYFYPLETMEYDIPLTVKYFPLNENSSTFIVNQWSGLGDGASSDAKHVLQSRQRTDRSRIETASTAGSTTSRHRQKALEIKPVVPEILKFTAKVLGYDPRKERPYADGAFTPGGIPPRIPFITAPRQVATLSSDLVDYNVVPQCCSAHRMIILRNFLQNSPIEFTVEPKSGFFLSENILSVHPQSGALQPGEHVVLNFKLEANCIPMMLSDRVKITTREIIREPPQRRMAGSKTKLLEKIKSSKTTIRKEHESIITRNTEVVNINLKSEGRSGNLPSSINVKGELVTTKESAAALAAKETGGLESAMNGGEGLDETGTGDAMPTTVSLSPSRLGTGDNGGYANRGGSVSPSRLGTGGGAPAGSAAASMYRAGTASSAGFSAKSRADEGRIIFGEPQVLVVRVTAEIFKREYVKTQLEMGPLEHLSEGFIVPPVPLFIKPATCIPKKSELETLAELVTSDGDYVMDDMASASQDSFDGGSIQSFGSLGRGSNLGTVGNEFKRVLAKKAQEALLQLEKMKMPVLQEGSREMSRDGPRESAGRLMQYGSSKAAPMQLSRAPSQQPSRASSRILSRNVSEQSLASFSDEEPGSPKRPAPLTKGSSFNLASAPHGISAGSPKNHVARTPEAPKNAMLKTKSSKGNFYSGKKSDKHASEADGREMELRAMSECVAFDLFRNLLTSTEVQEYTQRVLDESHDANPKNGNVRVDASVDYESQLISPLVGTPPYGVFFKDVIPKKPLCERVVWELRYLGYDNADSEDTVDKSKGRYMGRGTGRLDPVVPGIPSLWTASSQAPVSDAYHFAMDRHAVLKAMHEIGVPRDGLVSKEISGYLSKEGDSKRKKINHDAGKANVLIAFLLNRLSAPAMEELDGVLTDCHVQRSFDRLNAQEQATAPVAPSRRGSLLQREGIVPKTEPQNSSSAGGLPVDEPQVMILGEEGSITPVDGDGDGDAKDGCKDEEADTFDALSMADVGSSLAASAVSLTPYRQTLQEKLDTKKATFEALAQDGFVESAAEVLRNTMFNLIQEATFGEFAYDADPLKFMTKR